MSKTRTGNRPEEALIKDTADKRRQKRTEEAVASRKPEEPEKTAEKAEGEPDDVDPSIAELMNQNRVVFILEGDKESETIPDIGITDPAAANELQLTTTTGGANETAGKEGFALPETELSVPDAETGADMAAQTPVDAQGLATEAALDNMKPDNGIKNEVKEDAPAAEDADIGEVMARTPKIRTTEQSGTEGNTGSGENSEDGDLSPLENKNDMSAKTPKMKREKTEDGAEPVKNGEQKVTQTAQPQLTDIKPEKVHAAEQLRQAVPNEPVTTENMFDAMVERIDYMKSSDTSQAAIHLKPEFLGEISLRISLGADGLNIRIDAGDKDVRSMINSQIQLLVDELSNKGIEVSKVEVAYTGVDNGAYGDPQEKESQQPRQTRGGRQTVGGVTLDEASYALNALEEMAGYVDMELSSVEYRA